MGIGALARAQQTEPTAPTCSVSSDPEIVSPAGVLHVLQDAQILRFSLLAGSARPPLSLADSADELAFLPPLNALVIARADPPSLSLRSLMDDADELPFAEEALSDASSLCGMTTTDQQVVVCVDHNHYLVLNAAGEVVSEADVGDFIAPEEPNDPNDPNAPPPVDIPSWDDMAFDAVTRTLFSVRNQGHLLGAFAQPVDTDGTLGDAASSDPNALGVFDPLDPNAPDPNAPRAAQPLSLASGGRLIAPDGLELSTDPFEITQIPQLAQGQLFALGDAVVTLGGASGTNGCGLTSEDLGLAKGALVSTGPIRTAERQGREWIVRGDGADATVSELFPGTGDLDRDHSPDSRDFFPFEHAAAGRDWDHDGIPDPNDAFPTKLDEWLDSDGDKVGDNEDAFPDDPNEQVDSDGDGVGDKEDGCPNDPSGTSDLDGDSVCDDTDAFPIDPLEQTDDDEDGVGDNAEAQDTELGEPIALYQVSVKRDARLRGFSHETTTDSELLILFDNDRFELCAPADCEAEAGLTGSIVKRNQSGTRLGLELDIAAMSALEPVFAEAGAELVAADQADPPSPTLTFYPDQVTSKGSVTLGKKGATLSLQLDLRYDRGARGARGARGRLVYKAKGPPAD